MNWGRIFKRPRASLLVLLAVAATATAMFVYGTAPMAEVSYHDWNEPSRADNWIPYQLTDSVLVIGLADKNLGTEDRSPPSRPKPSVPPSPNAHAAAATEGDRYSTLLRTATLGCFSNDCAQSLSVVTVPAAFEGVTLGIEPARHWFSATRIAPAYYENSIRLRTLEISVEDKREETLQTVASLAAGVAKVTGGETRGPTPTESLRLPIVIDLSDAKRALQRDVELPNNRGWTYRAQFLDAPDRAGFLKLAERKRVHGAILTSLCRPLRLTLSNDDTSIVIGATVADPDYLLSIPLPDSGTVVFGGLCGANIEMGKAVSTPANVLVDDFFNDVKAIRASLGPNSASAAH